MKKQMCLSVFTAGAFLAVQAIETAGDLLMDLDAADLSLPNNTAVGYWNNDGTLGNYFTNVVANKGPLYQTNVGGVPAVTFQAYSIDSVMTNVVEVPASICGTNTWSFETWVFNPSLTGTEIAFSWTARNKWPDGVSAGSCWEFRYGADTANAVEHVAYNIPWYTGPNPAMVPPVGVWHHVAATRDAEGRERLFVDGQMKAITTPLITRVRTDGMFSLGSTRDYAYTNTTAGQAWSALFSGSIAKLRIHDGTLSASNVVANYLEERAAFGVNVTPDSTWSGAPDAALPWEEASNWGGGVPGIDSRVNIANGGTAVLTTAVGGVGRFLPFHGGLIMSNNAALTALPWQGPHVYMGLGSNNVFNLFIKEGSFSMLDYTNSHYLYFGNSFAPAYGVIGGGTLPAVLDGARDVVIGNGNSAFARMTIENNGALYTSNGWIYVATGGRADGKLTVNAGGYVGHRMTGKDIVVSDSTGYGVLEVNGGVVAPSQDFNLTRGNNANAYGAIQHNGGLLQFRRMYAGQAAGTNILFLNGGTLRNRDSRTDFLQGLDWAYVQPGGAVFDLLANSAVTVAQPLLTDPNLGDGGLTKIGNGTLTLGGANTITGDISVVTGDLLFSNAGGLPDGYAGTITVAANASIGYAKAGSVAQMMARMDSNSAGTIALTVSNAADNVDLSGWPNLNLGFQSGVTYTGTYTPYGQNYRFAPVNTGNVYAQAIGTTFSVTLNGGPAGSLELTGDNSYTGGTTINGGMLMMGHVNALGDPATVTIPDIGIYNGAALSLKAVGIPESIVTRIKPDSQGYIILGTNYAGINLDLTGLPGIKIGTDQANLYYNGVITPEGDVYRTGGGRVSYASGNYGLVLTNLIDNGATPRTLVVDGYGMVRPAGTYNNYSGGTIVSNSGALHLREDSGLGKVPTDYDPDNVYVNSGVFRPGSTTFTMNAKRGLTVGPDGMILHPNGSQTFTMLGSLHGSGAITNTDSGSVVLGGTSNTYDGTLTLNTGTINVGNGSNFSWNTNAVVNGVDGTFVVNYNGNLDWSSSLGSPLGVGGWPFLNFRKTGSGTLTMDAPQFYTRNTTIDNGTLKVGALTGIPSGHNRGNVTVQNLNYIPPAKLDVNGYDMTLNGLYGAGVVTDSLATASSVSVGDNNQWSTFNGKVAQTLALNKIGTLPLVLNKGAEAYDANVTMGNLTMWPGAILAGNVDLVSGTTLNVGTNLYSMNGLLGEYYDFSNTALRHYATVTSLVSLAKFTQVLAPFAPATIAISSVSNVFSFGSTGALFQNKGDYRVGRWTGKFLAEADGVYGFDTMSDDGSMVFVDGVTVVSNDFAGAYSPRRPGRVLQTITLSAGWHEIVVAYFNGTSNYGLSLFMTPPGGSESELPQSLLRPPSVQVGTLTGHTNATAWFYTDKSALTLGSTDSAVFDGFVTGTNALMAIEKVGTGAQTLKRVAFQGATDVREGTLALQGSPMLGGAVQALNGAVMVTNGTLSVRSYAADWPNAGLAGSYYNNANFSGWFNTLTAITNKFNTLIPDLLAGTRLAGDYFKINPNSLFPAPYNSGSFNDFQALYQGKFVARESGTYGFYLNSDDRTDLYIDSIQVITNAVSGTPKSGTAFLTAGTHDCFVPFQQGGGGYAIYMNWTPPGGTNGTLPNAVLRPCVAQTGPLTTYDGATVALPDMGSFLRLNQTSNTVAAGVFDGVEGSEVEKTGAARLLLSGNNEASFLGNWFVSQGELWAGDGATGGTLGGSNAYISGGAALVFNRSDDITYGGAIAGKGEIRSAGTGKLTLAGNATAFEGTLRVGEGQDLSLNRTLVATNALVDNNGTFRLSGRSAFLEGARITGTGTVRLEDDATLNLGLAEADFANSLVVSNGVLALAVTNTASAWQLDRLTLYAGTALQVNPSGLWGRFYDVPSGDAGVILSNAFLTYTSAANYFAGKTPSLIASTWLQGDGFEFGADASGSAGTALFPGKYRKPAGQANNYFAGFWEGKIRITEPGTYTFSTYSDDGSCIYINGETVANNAGSHGMQTRSGTVVLTNGLHDIAIVFQQGSGGFGLSASVTLPGATTSRILPNAMLVAAAADTPAYTLTVDTVAVTNAPGAGTVAFSGPGTLKLTDLWVDTGSRLAVTGSVAVAGSVLNVTVSEEVPFGKTVVGDFTGTDGLDLSGVTQTLTGSDGNLQYRDKVLFIGRSSGTILILH